MYLQQGNQDLALNDFQQAVAIDPNLAISYMGMGAVYKQMGNFEAARSNLQKSQQLFFEQGNTIYAEQVANLLQELPR